MKNKKMKYPICIVSKGRHESMLTSRALSELKVHHYIAIEPQDEENYEQALDQFNIRKFVTLLILPFSNHGDGPGRARNWWWNYSKQVLGTKRHWVMDDNIRHFSSLNNNTKTKIDNEYLFRTCEDFVDQFTNIAMAGLQYDFFIYTRTKYPPYTINTRIYSCNLIDNNCPYKWRGRYNEDTILSLDILKAGLCTIQFNHLLQGKVGTQTIKGGNTAEFYHVEGNIDKSTWRDGTMNSEGTFFKSKMLVDTHPDVAKLVWRYGRYHHHVNYSSFKKNKLAVNDDHYCRRVA